MILVLCTDCSLAVRIMGDPEEIDSLVGESSELWPDKFPCPECERQVRAFLEADVDPQIGLVTRIVDLSPQEAFAAFNGLGLPDELNCTIQALTDLLKEQPIKKIAGRNILGSTRCTVTHLELEDGSKVYLGAGAGGACVYRIVRPQSHVERVDGG